MDARGGEFSKVPYLGTSYQLTIMPELLPNLRYRLLGYGTFCSKAREAKVPVGSEKSSSVFALTIQIRTRICASLTFVD